MIEDILGDRKANNNDFKWASRSWKSSEYFTRGSQKETREILALVMSSSRVKSAIHEVFIYLLKSLVIELSREKLW